MRGFKKLCAAIAMALVWCGAACADGAIGHWSFHHGEGQTWYEVVLTQPARTYSADRGHNAKPLAAGASVALTGFDHGVEKKKGTLRNEGGRLVIQNLAGKTVFVCRPGGVIVRAGAVAKTVAQTVPRTRSKTSESAPRAKPQLLKNPFDTSVSA